MIIKLSEDEIKEAVAEYMVNHRGELLVARDGGTTESPEMEFVWDNVKPDNKLSVNIQLDTDVQYGHHPYR